MKLHIGSRTRAEGWTSFDIGPGPEVDFVGNCKDLSQFADASVETIYASHVLEHLQYKDELPAALKEWFRVLRPNGTVMISVPDLETLCRLFLHPQLNGDQRFFVMRMMFGGETDAHDIHLVGLTFEFLGFFLSQAGFVNVVRVLDLGVFNDTSRLKFGDVPISLNVTAAKPA
jgi:predicted SAM-dependent methyltransferase